MEKKTSELITETPIIEKSIPNCLNCPSIPIISINDNNILDISCQCGEDTQISIKDYLNQINTIRYKCNRHPNESAISYCMECKQWFCTSCLEFHYSLLKNHTISKLNELFIIKCQTHKKDKEYYCEECKTHLCLECKNNHQNNHNFINIPSICSDINFEHLKMMINEGEKYLKEYYPQIYYQYKNQLQQEYENSLNRNKEILQLYSLMVNCFTPGKFINYNLLRNITTINLQFNKYKNGDFIDYLKYNNINNKEGEFNSKILKLIKPIKTNNDYIYFNEILKDGKVFLCSDNKIINISNMKDFSCYYNLEPILENYKEETSNSKWSEIIINIFKNCEKKEEFILKIISSYRENEKIEDYEIRKYKIISSKLNNLKLLGKNKKIQDLHTVINKVWFSKNLSSKIENYIETKIKKKEKESLDVNFLIKQIEESTEEISIKLLYFLFCISLFKKELKICQKIPTFKKEVCSIGKLAQNANNINFDNLKIKKETLNEKEILKFVKISLYNFCFQVFQVRDPIKIYFEYMSKIYENAILENIMFINEFLTSLLHNIYFLSSEIQNDNWKEYLLSFDWNQKAINCISEEVYQKIFLFSLYHKPVLFFSNQDANIYYQAITRLNKTKDLSMLCYKYFKYKEKKKHFEDILLTFNNNPQFQNQNYSSFFQFFTVIIKNLKNKEKVSQEISNRFGLFSNLTTLENQISKLNQSIGENYFMTERASNVENAFEGYSEIVLISAENEDDKNKLLAIQSQKYIIKGIIIPGRLSSDLYIRVNFDLKLYYDMQNKQYLNNFDCIKERKYIFIFHKRGRPLQQKDEISFIGWFLNLQNAEFKKNYYTFLFDVLQMFPLSYKIFNKRIDEYIYKFNLQEEFKKFFFLLNHDTLDHFRLIFERVAPNSEMMKYIQRLLKNIELSREYTNTGE